MRGIVTFELRARGANRDLHSGNWGGVAPNPLFDSPFTEPIRRGIVAAQGQEPLLVPAMGGSLPEYVFTRTLGIPVFGVPYANADEANHAPNENLEIERFFVGIKTGAAMLASLGAARTARPTELGRD